MFRVEFSFAIEAAGFFEAVWTVTIYFMDFL
jgi:hypothetical protein